MLRQTVVEAFEKAYELTVRRHDGGIASGIDVNCVRTVLGNARAATLRRRRATSAATEYEIAALVGELASNFTIPPPCNHWTPPPCPPACPRTCFNAGLISPPPSGVWPPPMRRSAWRVRLSSRR